MFWYLLLKMKVHFRKQIILELCVDRHLPQQRRGLQRPSLSPFLWSSESLPGCVWPCSGYRVGGIPQRETWTQQGWVACPGSHSGVWLGVCQLQDLKTSACPLLSPPLPPPAEPPSQKHSLGACEGGACGAARPGHSLRAVWVLPGALSCLRRLPSERSCPAACAPRAGPHGLDGFCGPVVLPA